SNDIITEGKSKMETEQWDMDGTTLSLSSTNSNLVINVAISHLEDLMILFDKNEVYHCIESNSVSHFINVRIAAQHSLTDIRNILNNNFTTIVNATSSSPSFIRPRNESSQFV
ncbi:hypothetical protein LCGC14_3078580, partial [marine sediment metagenome]